MESQFGSFDASVASAIPQINAPTVASGGAVPMERGIEGMVPQLNSAEALSSFASAQSILLNKLPPVDFEFLSTIADKFPTDLEALREAFSKEELVEGKNIPKHRAYVCRINEACSWHSWNVVGFSVVSLPNDVWLICLGRLIIPGVGVMDSIGSASYMDTCVLPARRNNIANVNYSGYSPSSRFNQSDLASVAFEWVKMAETNAYVRAAFRLGVGAKTLMNFGNDTEVVDYGNMGGPVTPGAAFNPDSTAQSPLPASSFGQPPSSAPSLSSSSIIDQSLTPPPVQSEPIGGVQTSSFTPPPIVGAMAPIMNVEANAPAAGVITAGDPVRSLHDAATPEERNNLISIAQGRGVSREDLDNMAQQKFQTSFDQLNRAQLVGLSNSIESG